MHQLAWPFRTLRFALVAPVFWSVSGFAAEPDPAVMSFELPDQIPWTEGRGASQAILVGDPAKPGLYVVIVGIGPAAATSAEGASVR